MLKILYEMILWILALFASPKFIYDLVFRKKYRKSLLKRWGIDLPRLKKNQKPVIWIHAVSLGETKAVVALSKELKEIFPECRLIISSITETGHEEAKKSIPVADDHIYLPFDFNFLMKKAIKTFSPDLILISESDFWFNFLQNGKKNGALIGLVNGKISERSAHRFAKFPYFSRPLFDLFDLFCLQNTFYQDRFTQMGIPKERTTVTGNLKFDDDYPVLSSEEVFSWKEKLRIKPHELVLTIGSTHDPEESLLLEVVQQVWKVCPHLKVLLIPRHPERYGDAAKIVEKLGIPWVNYSELEGHSDTNEKVIILNRMGLLRIAYQLSTISIVGGSFTSKVGGHNILEPCWYAKPVIFGPYMHTQVEFVELIQKYQCGLQMNLEEIVTQLPQLLNNEAELKRLGENGMKMMQDLKGSTTRTVIALEPLLQKIVKKKIQIVCL